MKTVRSFLAVNLELETVKKIAKVQGALIEKAAQMDAAVNWVPPQNMHVTIRFLGNITEPMIGVIKDTLEPVTRKTPPIEIHSRGLGVFPDAENPKVLWAGVDDSEGLTTLHNEVCRLLNDTGFQKKDQPFKSHATIGRVKEATGEQVAALLEDTETTFGVSVLKNLLCYSSELSDRGADYRLLWKLPLQGRPVRQAPTPEPDKETTTETGTQKPEENNENDTTAPGTEDDNQGAQE